MTNIQPAKGKTAELWKGDSVTRLGNLVHFGQIFKPVADFFCQNHPHLGKFCKGVKIFNFLLMSFLGNFCRHWATFYWAGPCLFQDTEHVGDVYQDEANEAAMLLYRDKTDDALLMVNRLNY